MAIESWFATPIYYNYVDNISEVQNQIQTALDKSTFGQAPGWGSSTHKVSDPTFGNNIIDDLNLDIVRHEIEKHVLEYIQSLGGDVSRKFKISSSWLTQTKTKEYTRIHNHGYSDMSGVYYFKTNQNDGDLVFLSPNGHLATMVFADVKDTVSYTPEEGKIILFPGWLYHTVGENETLDDRISLSFNVYFDR